MWWTKCIWFRFVLLYLMSRSKQLIIIDKQLGWSSIHSSPTSDGTASFQRPHPRARSWKMFSPIISSIKDVTKFFSISKINDQQYISSSILKIHRLQSHCPGKEADPAQHAWNQLFSYSIVPWLPWDTNMMFYSHPKERT